MEATIGPGYEEMVWERARRLREWIDDPTHYVERVIEDTEQDFHDGYVDTDWPKCPRHDGRHPLWVREGAWWCERDRVRIAALGDLRSRLGPRSPQSV